MKLRCPRETATFLCYREGFTVVRCAMWCYREKAEQIKREGKLIGDREVVEAVLESLLDKLFT